MNSGTPVFDLRGVSKVFGGVQALAGITLRIGAAERVALVGPSGAGKSTLLNVLNGTLSVTEGKVNVLGRDLQRMPARARRLVQREIGTIYQQLHLVDNLSVIHNVNAGHLGHWSFMRAALSLIWPLDVSTARSALDQVGIPEKLYARTDELSGGQQQRVALARVLVQNPAAILADEPIASLDPERSREIMNLLRDLSIATGKTLVTSLHAVEYACSHCDRVVGLRDGQIMFDLPSGNVTEAEIAALYNLEHAQ